ncbi:MAG: mRNA surveillance protein pelota [Candidatus Jordarchaeales archaeon]|nr:mRNA surveillance protein pelota [Candidatus Jordarchaeia archaeon]
MKILENKLDKGEVTLHVENHNDLWHLYNIICKGDLVYARTHRRIRKVGDDSRSDRGERIPVYLGIKVEDVEFHKYSDRLRVKGIIVNGPDEISKGEHHTINVEIGKTLKIVKEDWPSYIIDRLSEASRGMEERVIIVTIEEGEAFIASVDRVTLTPLLRISESIPGKRAEEEREVGLKTFYSKVARSILHHAKQLNPVSIIIAGPGLTKNRLKDYIAVNYPEVEKLIVLENASYGDENGIYEVIRRGAVDKVISESRAVKEIEAVEEFLAQLAKNPEKVAYGGEQVEKAALYGAIHKLLITTKMIRDATPDERRKIEELIKSVERTRGEVILIDEAHAAGQQLSSLGGIAAVLRYSVNEA